MDDMNMSTVNLRENRYNAVLHLVTAADGAEEFYSKANNAARFENAEQARQRDRRLQKAYQGMGHDTWIKIDN